MLIGDHDTNEKVFIIAEAGNCHEGCITRAEEMIVEAKKAGADAIKFQAIIPEKLFSNPEQIERYKKLCLPLSCFVPLKKRCDMEGIKFMATHFDFEGLDFLDSLGVPAFKISSGDNDYIELIDATIACNKPILISKGFGKMAFDRDIIWESGGKYLNIINMHCVSKYPTSFQESMMRMLDLDNIDGYSDHTIGKTACLVAAARRVRIIEKHFTLDNNQSDFRDHKLALNPTDFASMVRDIRNIEIMNDAPWVDVGDRPDKPDEHLFRRTVTKPGIKERLRP